MVISDYSNQDKPPAPMLKDALEQYQLLRIQQQSTVLIILGYTDFQNRHPLVTNKDISHNNSIFAPHLSSIFGKCDIFETFSVPRAPLAWMYKIGFVPVYTHT